MSQNVFLKKLSLTFAVFLFQSLAFSLESIQAGQLFGLPHLAALDAQADDLLNKARACVANDSKRLSDWYFNASKDICPHLRIELQSLQASIWSLLSTSDLKLPPPQSSPNWAFLEKVMGEDSFLARASSDYVIEPVLNVKAYKEAARGYTKTLESHGVVQLSPLLAQELARTYVLGMKDGLWDPQFHYTLYCIYDPIKTCPIESPTWKGKVTERQYGDGNGPEIFMEYGFTVRMPMVQWTKAVLNSVTILSFLPTNEWQTSFIDASTLGEYNMTILRRGFADLPLVGHVMANSGFDLNWVGQRKKVWLQWEFLWARMRFLFFANPNAATLMPYLRDSSEAFYEHGVKLTTEAIKTTAVVSRYRGATIDPHSVVIRLDCKMDPNDPKFCRKTMPERADYGAPFAAGLEARWREKQNNMGVSPFAGARLILGLTGRAVGPTYKNDKSSPDFGVDDDLSTYGGPSSKGKRSGKK